MDRYWFLTWTTYGTWLPGDDRGFVSNVGYGEGPEVRLNLVGTEPNSSMRGLEISAKKLMKGPPMFLEANHVRPLWKQFEETARFHYLELIGGAIMRNHVHLVFGTKGDPDPHKLMGDFKSYGSRVLSAMSGKAKSGRWWTESGSCRKLKNQDSVNAAVEYVRNQEYPLFVWTKV